MSILKLLKMHHVSYVHVICGILSVVLIVASPSNASNITATGRHANVIWLTVVTLKWRLLVLF